MARKQKSKGSRAGKIARRTFLVGSLAVAGGVAFGVWRYKTPYGNPLAEGLKEGEAALTPFVKIDADGVTIITPRAEMGQGIHSTLAALVAEELDMAWDDIRVIHGPPAKAYLNQAVLEEGLPYAAIDISDAAERMRVIAKGAGKFLAMQITGGSSSIPDGFMKMRLAGAAARGALIEAAAQRLGVPANVLVTQEGAVVTRDGTRIAYTDLAMEAAQVDLRKKPKLKPQSEWRYLGKSMPRLDMASKSTGTAQFSIDVRLPDMLFASVKMGPHILYPIKSYDASKAETMPGVKQIVKIPDGVAVLATNTWNAMQAAKTIRVDYEPPSYPLTTDGQFDALAQSFAGDSDSENRNDGDVDTALSKGNIIEREYKVPYLAHATMEPMNATALLKNGRLDVWAGNQLPTQIVKEAKAITKLSVENIHVHTTLMGGGFGRRAEMDYIKQAIHIAKAVEGTPVKLTYSRENDTQYDAYRPLAMARFRAKLDGDKLVALDSQFAAPSILSSQFGRIGLSMPGPDATIVQSTWDQPYDFANFRVRGHRPPVMMPIGSWRSVGASQNAFFLESMIDEMAHEAGVDPLEFRLSQITHEPSRKVLEKVAEMSGWGGELLPDRARGVAFCLSFGVPTAEVIEVLQTDDGIKIDKAFAAVDVGTALDPRNIEAQVFGAMNFGLAAAMTGEITISNGYVEQSNFHDYDSLRMYQAPSVKVAILENGEKVRGIGEPGTPPAAPALANAVFALTGKRIRDLPLRNHVKFI
ncbi:xanthine dehydrogenase family protein molybdopterin-binding subunit [Robiginitomaculum antarcticum]|uniref:xanthine dehydrogenase family protein molybdopterin-binding subunit n=1 Tax=Robiginitomaculum antarcticum TaxID=437507 RepID=UPI00036A4CEF|nr:molybdopterin cofactor-binding domain-containing protein [Robiginitomaculum antarcticum]